MSVKLPGDGQEAVAHAQIPTEVPCEEATEACLGSEVPDGVVQERMAFVLRA
jgi:hypothetical protein